MERMPPTKVFQGKKYFIVEDLVKILSLTPLTVREYLKKGKIKAIKVGMRYYVAEQELIKFLNGGRFTKPDEFASQVNEAIRRTFEANVPWLANEIKKLIAKDLTEVMSERFKQIDENNKQFSGRIAEQLKGREKDVKKDFESAQKL
ncbi:hypothetical protein ES705_13744 [subsurface metagenome]